MPVASEEVWRVLYMVSRYLFPLLAFILVFLIFFYILSEGRIRNEKVRSIPGFGTVGELIVLSGSRDLDVNTWFPVPREGILGSMRSCDLVIPCPGVHLKHLDFSWEDGTGLLIRPRTGCEVIIDGISVTCRTNASDVPLQHGSVLQVGSAVLRLHLFAALDNTTAPVQQPVAESPHQITEYRQLLPASIPFSSAGTTPDCQNPSGLPLQDHPCEPVNSVMDTLPFSVLPDEHTSPPAAAGRNVRQHSDSWKEDFGE